MAYRVLFWKPAPGVDPFLPADAPLGESIYDALRAGQRSDDLLDWDTAAFATRFVELFPSASYDGEVAEWSSETDAIMLRRGAQHIDACLFEHMAIEGADLLWDIADSLGVEHFDGWRSH